MKSYQVESLEELLDILGPSSKTINPGEKLFDQVIGLLGACWSMFDGSNRTKMDGGKLYRAEKLSWNPPLLSFEIERHGAMFYGSTRAEVQDWEVNLEKKDVIIWNTRRIQKYPAQERVNFQKTAAELAKIMKARKPDRRIKYHKDGRVRVFASKVFPESFDQTNANRSRRLREELRKILEPEGWSFLGYGVYYPPDAE